MIEQRPIAESRRAADQSIALGERVGERWSYLTLAEQESVVKMVEAMTQDEWDADNGNQ